MSAPKLCTKCGASIDAPELATEERELCTACHPVDSGAVFAGPEAVELYRLIVLRGAMRLYLRTGMKAGRSWTPQNMRNAAGAALGVEYPRSRRGLEQAYQDLDEALQAVRPTNRPRA